MCTLLLSTGEVNAASEAIIKVDPLNVRSGPGLSYETIGQVHKKEKYQIVDEKGNWIQIKLGSKTGWVAKWLVEVNTTEVSNSLAISKVDRLRVRSGPGTSNAVIGYMNKGIELEKLGEKGSWTKVSYQKQDGWVHNDFISTKKSVSATQASESYVQVNNLNVRKEPSLQASKLDKLKKGTKVVTKETTNEWARITYGQKQGWVYAKYLGNKAPSKPNSTPTKESNSPTEVLGTVTVQTPILNVRSEGRLGSKLVTKVRRGESYSYLQEKNSWYQIKLNNGKTGWVANWLVEKNNNTAKKNEEAITLLYNATNIRKGPSTETSIVGRGSMGDRYKVKSKNGEWYEIAFNGSSAYVASWIVTTSSSTIQQLSNKKQSLSNKTIVIDAGHGGRDVGTIGIDGFYEKTLTIKTANLLAERLRLAGAKVILTRSEDDYISLSSRAAMSNVMSADAFISLHYNSFPQSPSVSGIGTYYYHKQHKDFANAVQKEMIRATGLKNRKAQFGDYHVIRENRQPALLLELGFLSNPKEAKHVQTNDFQEKITKGIAKGIINYLQN